MIIDCEPTQHAPTRRKIALMSGLSDPASCAFSEIQRDFFRRLSGDETEKVPCNFPYRPQDSSPHRPPSLLAASWANACQFWLASGARYRTTATRHWNALVQSCDDLTVITLSCGLEILNSCLVTGQRPQSLRVISLGPVARARPAAPHTLIRGARDYISMPFFRKAEILLPGVGHLNYLDRTETVEIVNQLLRQRL